jgi:FlaA1/EpsC-like NDP-sugar epimerase
MVEVFERHRPDVVFHAAAYKHVPLLEASPLEGVATNVLGTRWVVGAARHVGVGRFVLFSTDKAVQPTSILGQTKAVAEWIVAAAGCGPGQGQYASVRLGNVVDSAGSIVPVFRRQVARGVPVTVTHPEATRYLMTAREAAGLALVAGGLADSNSVFWLDVGPPVSVIDLARRLASSVSEDVRIQLVGLRPGERLHERPFVSSDVTSPTPCEYVWRSRMSTVNEAWLSDRLGVLARHVRQADAPRARATLAEMHSSTKQAETLPAALVAH